MEPQAVHVIHTILLNDEEQTEIIDSLCNNYGSLGQVFAFFCLFIFSKILLFW